MNTQKVAAALHALADALTESSPVPATAGNAAPSESNAPAQAAAKPRGRPPKGAEGAHAAAPTQTAAVAAPAAAAPAVSAPAAQASVPANGLTHAIVANSFKAAAAKHGRDFVVNAMKKYNAPTFDKVPQAAWPEFKATLEAGPVAAAPVDPTADLMG